jgi:hypothetical protein
MAFVKAGTSAGRVGSLPGKRVYEPEGRFSFLRFPRTHLPVSAILFCYAN